MKLRFYINNKGIKLYTLKEKIQDKSTQEAHYKFIKYIENINNN